MRRKCVEDEFGQGYTFGNQDEEYDSAERTYRVEFVKEDKEEDSLKITFYRINGINDGETIQSLIKFLKSLASFGRFKGGKERLKIEFTIESSNKKNVPVAAVKEYFSSQLYRLVDIKYSTYKKWW